jgi:hypothetical protein
MRINFQMIEWGLEELSSRFEQERLWLGTDQCEISSFEEAVCSVFTDSLLDLVMQSDSPTGLGIAEEEKFNLLGRLVDSVETDCQPEIVINSPEMTKIRRVSSELLDLLRQSGKL